MTEDDIRRMVRTMHHGGCDNSAIASAAARCARTLGGARGTQRGLPAAELREFAEREALALCSILRQEGWFE